MPVEILINAGNDREKMFGFLKDLGSPLPPLTVAVTKTTVMFYWYHLPHTKRTYVMSWLPVHPESCYSENKKQQKTEPRKTKLKLCRKYVSSLFSRDRNLHKRIFFPSPFSQEEIKVEGAKRLKKKVALYEDVLADIRKDIKNRLEKNPSQEADLSAALNEDQS